VIEHREEPQRREGTQSKTPLVPALQTHCLVTGRRVGPSLLPLRLFASLRLSCLRALNRYGLGPLEAVIERLARSPKLGITYCDLTALWEQEQAARQRFYEGIEDRQKVEFINGEIIVQESGAAHSAKSCGPCPTPLKAARASQRPLSVATCRSWSPTRCGLAGSLTS